MSENTLDFFKQQKQRLDAYLDAVLVAYQAEFAMHPHAAHTLAHVREFVQSGKSVRGSLLLEFGAAFLRAGPSAHAATPAHTTAHNELLALAAAIEIIHSAVLLQDDYMDQDSRRRGHPALYAQLEEHAVQQEYSNPQRYRASSLMCATDICFFMAFDKLGEFEHSRLPELMRFLMHEYIHVGFSQWEDVDFGHMRRKEQVTIKQIEQVYRYKTARYTFVMPLLLAAKIADMPLQDQAQLEIAAEHLGMVYQITDDNLNIFGDPSKTGKPLGSDITEFKKTFLQHFLFEALALPQHAAHQSVRQYFGASSLDGQALAKVRQAMQETGVLDRLRERIATHKRAFVAALAASSIDPGIVQQLTHVFEYIEQREK